MAEGIFAGRGRKIGLGKNKEKIKFDDFADVIYGFQNALELSTYLELHFWSYPGKALIFASIVYLFHNKL